MSEISTLTWYRDQVAFANKLTGKYEKLINLFSFLRLFVVFGAIFLIYESTSVQNVLLTEGVVLGAIVFFAWLMSFQSKFEEKQRFYKALKQVNENEINIILGQENTYDNGSAFINDNHVYTSDLDIFGKNSLYNLVNRCATALGNLKLSDWLKTASETPVILLRQEAIKELSDKKSWAQDFKALLLFAATDEDTLKKISSYLDLGPVSFNKWLRRYIAAAPFIFVGSGIVAYFFSAPTFFPIGAGLINFFIAIGHGRKVNLAAEGLGKTDKLLFSYSKAFQHIENESFTSSYICSLKLKSGISFHSTLKELSGLAGKLEYRLNVFIGPVLNIIFAWDVRQLLAIEKWKQENAGLVKVAFDDLGEMEALISLSSLCANYPEWKFPEIDKSSGYTYIANDIGHPLIPAERRVLNSFELTNDFRIDIITGSNMAGKSTFLRTMGINVVLALAGAPVCASEMRLSNMLIFTYMRIKDSLNESTSTFKAELDRLKLLLETLQSDRKVYFMIDEMLRGTNSMDKYLGSKAVIEKLIAQKAVGIVATHDLHIARLEENYPNVVRNFHFDIRIQDDEMLFDYKIKKGECKTFNAGTLLKRLGITFESEEIISSRNY